MNTYNLVKILLTIKPIQRKITLIEGLQYSKICSILAKGLDLDSIKLNQLYTSNKLLKKYNIPAENIEGYIYPQTYLFNWGQTEFEIIDYLLSQMKEQLEELKDSLSESNYTVHEIITLASIIEAESNFADEKPIVSSVYHNRLKKGWKLQADPTIIYILGKPQRVLFKHLEIDSPYNTYLYEGLPKGPINNPGIDAIKAAVFPADTKYMYFTGTGDGTGKHLFASSLIGHNKNRRQLDAARKNINKK